MCRSPPRAAALVAALLAACVGLSCPALQSTAITAQAHANLLAAEAAAPPRRAAAAAAPLRHYLVYTSAAGDWEFMKLLAMHLYTLQRVSIAMPPGTRLHIGILTRPTEVNAVLRVLDGTLTPQVLAAAGDAVYVKTQPMGDVYAAACGKLLVRRFLEAATETASSSDSSSHSDTGAAARHDLPFVFERIMYLDVDQLVVDAAAFVRLLVEVPLHPPGAVHLALDPSAGDPTLASCFSARAAAALKTTGASAADAGYDPSRGTNTGAMLFAGTNASLIASLERLHEEIAPLPVPQRAGMCYEQGNINDFLWGAGIADTALLEGRVAFDCSTAGGRECPPLPALQAPEGGTLLALLHMTSATPTGGVYGGAVLQPSRRKVARALTMLLRLGAGWPPHAVVAE